MPFKWKSDEIDLVFEKQNNTDIWTKYLASVPVENLTQASIDCDQNGELFVVLANQFSSNSTVKISDTSCCTWGIDFFCYEEQSEISTGYWAKKNGINFIFS